jgi:predicted O-methyltransferase YrrM
MNNKRLAINNAVKSLIDTILSIIHYQLSITGVHSIHSPFVFALYQEVIRPDYRADPVFKQIEAARKGLLSSSQRIQVTDFGAGPRLAGSRLAGPDSLPEPNNHNTRTRSVADIARRSLKPARYGRLLHRLVRRFAAGGTVLELGTSFGLTTSYLAAETSGRTHPAWLVTFEGCPETAAIARQQFERLGLSNIEIVVGNLDETLGPTLSGLDTVDLVFLDANHRFEPTVRYFEELATKAHNDTVFVLDDIHWSDEMEQAWDTIQAHPAVTVSVDLFGVGLIFFRREQSKQHFVLRF